MGRKITGHMQQRGPNAWRFYAYDKPDATGRRRQRTRTFHGTEPQARTALKRFVREIELGVTGDANTITVAQLCTKWCLHMERHWEPNTTRSYRSKIDTHIIPAIGDALVAKVSTAMLDDLYRDLGDRRSATTVRHVHAILHAAFAQAIRWSYIYENPATNTSPPPFALEEPGDIDVEVVRRAILTAPSELAEIADLAAITGAREAELCGLRWSDLDRHGFTLWFRRRVVTVKGGTVIRPLTKNRKTRRVGLDRRTVARLRLRHYRARQRARACGIELPADAFIFSETPDGRPLSPGTVAQRWYRHRIEQGLTLTFHQLRHFHGSVLLDAGHQLARVSERLGHSRTSITSDVYTHVMRATDHDLADTMRRSLRG